MSLRTYLLLLRPIRTLALAAFLQFGAFVILVAPMGVSLPEFALLALCLLLPLTLGSLLIAPLHEVAHRSSFPMLPGADRQLFRSHAIAFAGAALLLCGLALWLVSLIPPPAACGLILAALALPLLNPHQGITMGGNPIFGLTIIIGLILVILARTQLIALSHTAPWLLFVAGLAFTHVCFRLGFARDRLRARSANPFYFAPQSTLLFVGTDIQQHAQAESSRLAEQRSTRRGADWSAPAFRDTLRDWLRILHQARFGRSHWLSSNFSAFAATLAGTVTALLVCVLFDAGLDWQQWGTYCRLLVEAARSSGEIAQSDVRLNFVMMPQIGFAVALTGALMAGVPPQAFPLSRTRLANVLFLAFERRALLSLAGCAAGGIAVLATAALVAGQPWSFALLHRFLPLPAVALIAANLLPMAVFSRGALTQIFFGLLAFPGFIIATFAVVLRDSGSSSSVFSIAIFSILTMASLAFAWSTFRRHYRTCDLNRTGDSLRRLGFRLG